MPRFMPSARPASELGYAEISSNFTAPSTAAVAVTGLSVATVNPSDRPIAVEFECIGFGNTLGTATPASGAAAVGVVSYIQLYEDATVLRTAFVTTQVANQSFPVRFRARKASPGSHTYSIQIGSFSGTATLSAPASIEVLTV